uniref:WD_REPEATS_REGION domain-containing protein n=1 Tax=Schistocephalus solidus TaxID=70667 RepID=A0A183SIC5_SCHSO
LCVRKNTKSIASDSSGYVRLWNCFAGAGSKSLIFEWYESSIPCEFNNVSAEKPEPNEILCISLATDDSRFVTGGTDTVIKVAKTGLKRHCNYHTSRVTALRYHPRGEFDAAYSHIFVSASWDNSVQIWDDRNTGSLWQYYGPHVAGSDGLDVEASQNLILTSSWTRSSVLIQV